MNLNLESPDVIRQYLLGMLAQEQYLRLEQRLLTSNDLLEEILIAEDELIDEYLRGELSETEQKNFVVCFLKAPERQQKLRFSKTFKRYIKSAGTEGTSEGAGSVSQAFSARDYLSRLTRVRSPVVTFSLAATLLVLLSGVSWVLVRRVMTPRGAHNSLVVRLTPKLVRDAGETNRILIPADVNTVRLQLALPDDDYKTYRAALRSSGGAEIWAGNNVTVNTVGVDGYVQFDLPAEILGPDDYKVTLSGHLSEDKYEDVTNYSFRVVR